MRLPAPPRGLAGVEIRRGEDSFVVLSFPVAQELSFPPELTAAERRVVELVLAGASTSEIAKARGTSPRTVANQIQSVYRKLEVNSRAELAMLFHRVK